MEPNPRQSPQMPALSPDTALEPARAASRIYRSSRGSQQLHFRGQRKVIRKYGRRESTRSLQQSTLTQIGYGMQQSADLRELDILDEDAELSRLPYVQMSGRGELAPANSSSAQGRSKRQKTKNKHRGVVDAKKCFHTQTLTQFIPGQNINSHSNGIRDGIFGHHAMSWDSDHTPLSPRATSAIFHIQAEACEAAVSTQKPTEAAGASSIPAPTTPYRCRTEIPSSQPSPFTPVLFHDHCDDHPGWQQPSPSSSKMFGLARSTLSSSNSRDRPDNTFHARQTMWDPFFGWRSKSQSPTRDPVAQRIGICTDTEDMGLTNKTVTRVCKRAIQTRASPRHSGKDGYTSEDVIPDSDEDENEVSESDGFNDNVVQTMRHDSLPSDQSVADLARLWTPSRHEACLDMELGSPIPFRSRRRKLEVGNRQKIGQHESEWSPSHSLASANTISKDQKPLSQSFESQRVPLDVIRSLGQQTDRSDIIISIHPEQVQKIANGTKDHEFRAYKIPNTVGRFWIYATRPVCELKYMAVIAAGFRQPGEIDSNSGVGNAEFNAGRLVAKFAYKFVQVYQLNNPVSLDMMKQNGWVDGPPQRYTYVPSAAVSTLLGNLRCCHLDSEPGMRTDLQDKDGQNDGDGGQELSGSEVRLLGDSTEIRSRKRVFYGPVPQVNAPKLKPSTHQNSTSRLRPDGIRRLNAANASTYPQATNPISLPSQAAPGTRIYSKTTNKPPPTSQLWDTSRLIRNNAEEESSVKGSRNDHASNDLNDSIMRMEGFQNSEYTLHSRQPLEGPRIPRLRRQQPLMQRVITSSTESTQVVLPDSLYEEVRQAPPAVILDSEDSDTEL